MAPTEGHPDRGEDGRQQNHEHRVGCLSQRVDLPPEHDSIRVIASKRLSEVGACSNADQKIAAKMKSRMMMTKRFLLLCGQPATNEQIDK